MKKYTV